ncbi:MAG: putative heme-binding domain-containing protein [Mariniblastus sp.]|jgi:putative heme-binding domain-containing protein
MNWKSVFGLLIACALQVTAIAQEESAVKKNVRPLRALLICGGCCHDYAKQHKILFEGIQARANVQVDVWWTDDKSTNPPMTVFNNVNWAKNYDVIIHDECAASNTDVEVVKRILEVHKKTPAVHLHCAMHSFRNGTDLWFKHLGLRSTGHGPHAPIDVQFVDKEHPIVKGLVDWTIEKDELYNNAEVLTAHALATGKQTVKRNGKESTQEAIVVWTNETQGARSFSMSIGHYSDGVADERYLNLVTRGMLWACDKLSPDYQKPFTGKNVVTFVPTKGEEKEKQGKIKIMPKDPSPVHVSASSIQNQHDPTNLIDGDFKSRWCAENGTYPQWIQLDFKQPQLVTDIKITWERNVAYQYRILTSTDGKAFGTAVDGSKNDVDQPRFEKLSTANQPIKSLRIEGIGTREGGWCSIWEVEFKGKNADSFWPADKTFKPLFQPTPAGTQPEPAVADPNAKQGNIEPRIEPLSAAEEADILKDVKVPEGFEATLFAAPPAVNYPVFVAASPDGTLFVSSDGNGSLGRDPGRGRVIRLRDLDQDGKADETKVFCEVDAPRGLVWDHDRLYLMHPPHLSAFIDTDGDGVADEQKILVKNLAFDYDKRPADHTTNGLSLGVDGYLYVAGGDFGFIDAEGTDGRKLTHRGGGVIRVRPDGTGLELYSTGTRNILEVAISPQMDLFARDNTNDGGGWDVRFHHFTGGDNHGYPRLYKNFAEECIAPLADYGGGSGCGAVYIDEPGFGEWNQAPFSADWGTGALFHHSVASKGASFVETGPPKKLVQMTRPTDADIDGMSRLYCASWRGAQFKWAGPNVGYIVQVRPKGFQPKPIPEFSQLLDDQLVELFKSPSYRRRLEAQRELIRRNNPKQSLLFTQAIANRPQSRNLVYEIQNELPVSKVIAALDHSESVVQHVAIRELARRQANAECFAALDSNESDQINLLRALAMIHLPEVVDGLVERVSSNPNSDLRKRLLSTLCRLHFTEAKWTGQSWGTRPDTRGPYYQPEEWEATPKIAAVLQSQLDSADPQLAIFLAKEMSRNRIQSDHALRRLIALTQNNKSMIDAVVAQLAETKDIPDAAVPLLLSAALNSESKQKTLIGSIKALAKTSATDAIPAMFAALQSLSESKIPGSLIRQAQADCLRSDVVQNQITKVIEESNSSKEAAIWADGALLHIASQKNASPEAKAMADAAIKKAWNQLDRRVRLIHAAATTGSHLLDELILDSVNDDNPQISMSAAKAAKQLKLKPRRPDETPMLNTLDVEVAIDRVLKTRGDIEHGERLFTKANCIACHTVSKDEKPKGPYLGTIAQTYKRKELAYALLQPSKTIAQGFKTNIILDFDGRMITGYVTEESADRVVMRDQEGKEFSFDKQQIDERKESLVSAMPEGLVKDYSLGELASILDYLESLSKHNAPAKQ